MIGKEQGHDEEMGMPGLCSHYAGLLSSGMRLVIESDKNTMPEMCVFLSFMGRRRNVQMDAAPIAAEGSGRRSDREAPAPFFLFNLSVPSLLGKVMSRVLCQQKEWGIGFLF